jgi:hypothetical protein
MIVVKGIEIDGMFYPEYVPQTDFGCNFDGTNFIYFETQEEADEYYNNNIN